MQTTLIVEPNPDGHRFSYVRYVLENTRGMHLVLLTSQGATQTAAFQEQLAGRELEVLECFEDATPGAGVMVARLSTIAAAREVAHIVVMDADHPLKQWWWQARRSFRPLARRPTVSFLLTRYPLRPTWRSPRTWVRRLAMACLVALARGNGTLTGAVALSPRGGRQQGLLIRRVPDPADCRAHARDRTLLRVQHGLPAQQRLIGVFGVLTRDKNAPLLMEVIERLGDRYELLLAGDPDHEVRRWLDDLDPDARSRIHQRDGYLPEQVLDELVAASDVVAVVMNYDRPSAVMGKALGAGVPVVSAGSAVRAKELEATRGGIAAGLTVDSVEEAVRVLTSRGRLVEGHAAESASPAALVAALMEPVLGDADASPRRRIGRRSPADGNLNRATGAGHPHGPHRP